MDLRPLSLSLEIALFATSLSLIVGIAVAAALAKLRFWGRDLLDALLTAPMVLPPTVLGYYVLVAFGRTSAFGQAFEVLTGTSLVFTRTGAVFAATLGALPLVVKTVRNAFEQLDPMVVFTARTLGAGPVRVLLTIELPLAARGLFAGAMLAFARSLGDFGLTWVIGGNLRGETHTAAIEIYDALQAHRDGDALRMSLLLTAVGVALLYVAIKLTAKVSER